jgi:hypothetical protein
MRYENPHIPEDINDSERRPLVRFVWLSAAALAVVAAAGAAQFLLADRLTPLLPFRYEAAAASAAFSSRASPPRRGYPQTSAFTFTMTRCRS